MMKKKQAHPVATDADLEMVLRRIVDGMEDELLFVTEWEAELSFRQYLASKNFKKIIAAMDLAAEKPELSFHTISTTRGLEMLESISNQKIKMVN